MFCLKLLRVSGGVLLTIVFVLGKVTSEQGKSLFDEVPLNGALVPSDLDYNSAPSASVETKVTVPKNSPSTQKNFDETVYSLFDEVPNQGALSFESNEQNNNSNNNKIRTTRDSINFDITRINPSSNFDVPYWNKGFLTPIVNPIANPGPPRFPPGRGPPFTQSPRNTYGGSPPLRFEQQPIYQNHQARQTHYQGWTQPTTPTREDTSQNKTYQVSANSGGPTVIVYAHPKKEGTTAGQSDTEKTVTTEAPAKNEIHYHYHTNEDSKPKPPPYGRPPYPPRGPRPPPPWGYRPSKTGPYPPSAVSYPSVTYRTEVYNSETDDEDEFNKRTFLTLSKPSSFLSPKSPSTSYEIPPSVNAPSSSYAPSKYGPPEHKEPEPTYGPPTAAPPAPPPVADDAGTDQYETTITLQTIPVTRQVTELVQVPNVVHKISSNRPIQSQQAAQDDSYQPQQPSTVYGPPAPSPPRSQTLQQTQSTRITNLQDGERPFDRHLAQILGAGPTQNPKDTILQELLLNQARTPGFDLTLNDLELLSLLQGSRGGGLRTGILNPSTFNQGGWGAGSVGGLSGGGGGGGNDGLTSLRDAFREQRLQLALQDFRKQLRDQNRDSHKERSSYRSLFTKGAMLLSALTLIPSMLNPMIAAAGLGSATIPTIPNFMLPMSAAAGRRRRRSILLENTRNKMPFEKCLDESLLLLSNEVKNGTSTSYEKWLGCVNTVHVSQGPSSKKLSNPEDLANLQNLSHCIQRDFCTTVLETGNFSLLKVYSLLFENMDKNPWISQAVEAVGSGNCGVFHCIKKHY